MKNKLMLVIAVAVAVNSNAQTIIGTHSNDSVLLRANSGSNLSINNRIRLRAQGQVTFHDAPPTFVNGATSTIETASVSMKIRNSIDYIGLLVSDNPSQGIRRAQIAAVNSANSDGENAIFISNSKVVSDFRLSTNFGLASSEGNGGYYRLNKPENVSNRVFLGYKCYNNITTSQENIDFVSFASGGAIGATCNSIIDFLG